MTARPPFRPAAPRRHRSAARWWWLLPLCLLGPASLAAQPTNAALYGHLATRCLSTAPDTVGAFVLHAPADLPFLATDLAAGWHAAGYTVFLGDSAVVPPGLPRLTYHIDEAHVAYERLRRRQVQRTVTLALRYTLTAADGHLLAAAPCREAATDTLAVAALDAVESPAFPETRGERPPPRWPRRVVEPVVLTAATAVAVFLFFSLRSDRADEGL